MSTETRWPSFCRDALQNTVIRSSLSFQLFRNKESMGALNFYSDRAGAFTIHAVAAFDLLRRLSQESNTPPISLAEQVIHTAGES